MISHQELKLVFCNFYNAIQLGKIGGGSKKIPVGSNLLSSAAVYVNESIYHCSVEVQGGVTLDRGGYRIFPGGGAPA